MYMTNINRHSLGIGLVTPKCNFSRSEAAFSHSGPKIWNELPYRLRSLSSINEFKSGLKTHYFNVAFKDIT